MTSCNPGDVVLVPFPYTDLQTTKQRPALALKATGSKKIPPLLIVAMITSQIDSPFLEGDGLISLWQEAGLLHPSKVRLAKLVSVEQTLILKKIGTLSQKDREEISQKFRELFSDWIS